ncbi:hypothetical protein LWV33_21615 [Brucella intermedia]
MSNLRVVTLDTKAGAKQEIIDLARAILELAEAGEITDLAFAAAGLDGSVKTAFTATDDAPRRLAAVARLLHRFHTQMDVEAVQ